MQYLPEDLMLMTLLQGQYYLHEYLPYHVLCHVVFLVLALLDQLCHVAILAVLHNYVELPGLLVEYPKDISVNYASVWAFKSSQVALTCRSTSRCLDG